MKKVVTIIISFVSIVTFCACTAEPQPESFTKPKFLSVDIESQTASAIIRYSIEGAVNSKTSCVMLFGSEPSLSSAQQISSQILSDKVATFNIVGLQSYTDYYFKVILSNGIESVETAISTLKTKEILEPSPTDFTFKYLGGKAVIDISAVDEPEIKIVDSPWITIEETKVNVYSKTFVIAENGSLDARNARIEIIGKSMTKVISISQTGMPIPIPDTVFKSYLLKNFDNDGDEEISKEEGERIEEIRLNNNYELASLKGIEYFPNLVCLNVEIDHDGPRQGKLTSLDVSHNPKLRELVLCRHSVESLDVSNNTELVFLNVYGNALTELDVSKNTKLSGFCDFSNNYLTSFDFSNCPEITDFYIYDNQLTSIKYPKQNKLKVFNVGNNKLMSLDASDMSELEVFDAYRNQFYVLVLPPGNNLRSINLDVCSIIPQNDWSKYPLLEYLNLNWAKITSIDLSSNNKLKELQLCGTSIQTVDLTNQKQLLRLSLACTNIQTVDLTNQEQLEELCINDTKISSIDLSFFPKLRRLDIGGCQNLKTVDVSENRQLNDLWCHCDKLRILYIYKGQDLPGVTRDWDPNDWRLHEGTQIYCKDDPDFSTYVDIPDAVFRKYCLDNFDYNKDSKISVAEAKSVYQIFMNDLDNYKTLSGIEKFENLRELYCESLSGERESGTLTSLDVSKNLKLKDLRLQRQKIQKLNLSNNKQLERIHLDDSSIETLNLTGLSALKYLYVWECYHITSLDLSWSPELLDLGANGLGLSSMPDLSHNLKLQSIHICGTGGADFLSDPDYFKMFPDLRSVNFGGYSGGSINLTHNPLMESVWANCCSNIMEINLSNMPNIRDLHFNYCSRLKKILLNKNVDKETLIIETIDCPSDLKVEYR